MPDAQPTPDPAARTRATELEILYTLTKPDDNPFLWTVEELDRELGKCFHFQDAIIRPHGAGLIHRTTDGFIFASRAAVHQIELVGYGVI
ncbi:MAG TPA: hypothetical protein VK721_13860 [Solirubrobacteraceae bacterium]|jgi:hypothetical protein|nr:hypothetical protein [Solirubrobacteraceae bacterium]